MFRIKPETWIGFGLVLAHILLVSAIILQARENDQRHRQFQQFSQRQYQMCLMIAEAAENSPSACELPQHMQIED